MDNIDIKDAKRCARNVEQLQIVGLAMANGFVQGLHAAIELYEKQQAQAANQ